MRIGHGTDSGNTLLRHLLDKETSEARISLSALLVHIRTSLDVSKCPCIHIVLDVSEGVRGVFDNRDMLFSLLPRFQNIIEALGYPKFDAAGEKDTELDFFSLIHGSFRAHT